MDAISQNEDMTNFKMLFDKYKKVFGIIISIMLAVIIISGYWQYYMRNQAVRASEIYQELLIAELKQDPITVDTKGEMLLKQFAKTPYAQLARFILAKNAIKSNDIPKAEEYLVTASKQKTMQPIAAIRLAKLKVQSGKPQEALDVLNEQKIGKSFESIFEELKGDIYLAMNDREAAKAAYINARDNLPAGFQDGLLRLKLTDLGVSNG